jgi:hypothetical protein
MDNFKTTSYFVINLCVAPIKIARDKAINVIYENTQENNLESNQSNQNIDRTIVRLYPKPFYDDYLNFFNTPTNVFSLNTSNIYLGNSFNSASHWTLASRNIKYVMNVTSEIPNYYPNDFIYHKISIKDNNITSIVPYLDASYKILIEWLTKNDGNILVHCYMGSSRSASIIIYFLAKYYNEPVEEVLQKLKKNRPNINLTVQFKNDLINSISDDV